MGLRARWSLVELAGFALATVLYGACGGNSESDRFPASAGSGAASAAGAAGGAASVAGSANTGGANPGTLCIPAPLGDWKPVWTPPIAPMPGICNAEQLDTMTKVCVAPVTFNQTACDGFKRDHQNTDCLSCVFTPLSNSSYGAVIVDANNFWQSNTAGCVAQIEGDSTPDGCGAKVQAYEDCLRTACEASCWVGKSNDTFHSCADRASAGDCHTYLANEVCEKASKYNDCDSYADFVGYFTGTTNLFCGAGFSPTSPGASGGMGPAAAGAAGE